jgi:hypothetical protein
MGATNILCSVTYGNGLFVAVGNKGTILTSPNGTTWTESNSGTTGDLVLYSVTYGNGLFVAVGWNFTSLTGTVLTSPDGSTWTTRSMGATNILCSVTYGNSLFVAVGEGDTILTSVDGTTWTGRNSGTSGTLYLCSVTYGNGLFLVVGWDTAVLAGAVLISLDGSTWIYRDPGTTAGIYTTELTFVTYGNGLFVAVGIGVEERKGVWYKRILTSPNGTTWTATNLDTPATTIQPITSVTYGNSQFVAVGLGGTILTSKADNIGVIQSSSKVLYTSKLRININKNGIAALLPQTLTKEILTVGLFTIAGKKIYSATNQANKGTLNIPLASLSTGLYIISISGGNTALSSSFVVTK